ncbi:Glutathione synthase/Ribosomal protein S6 modification enzyme (glutaminyl transferase)-like [Frankia casuarinae]|uniref:Glutathione synthase/Ribosomal protein S6 modification enzyme (Glutaminyl transferase)-like n=1 Tax=Frankia casuarinae (strain DSM 45818 / CECT 9043 / HFP020203 / CcI3) TaxID=106370 RepID=Q2JB97_FRACC|nr:Glutathione synthase/Ribosomal protein S6 modification enzyme (glutaminyl transferase)-like [Frankia casuarinae]
MPDLVMLDSATPHIRSVSKFAMIHRLTQVGVPTQPTRSCSSIADFEAACAEWGSTVVKPSIGFGGHDVERFLDGDDEKGRLKVGDLLKTYGTLLCQPYFPHSGVLRVTTIGDQPSVSFNQVTGDDGWKPNHGHKWVYHAEDDEEYCACCTPRVKRLRNEMVDPKPEMVDLALRAAAAMELSMAGVDIIESDGQAMVLEVNACPGFSSLQSDLRTKIGEEIVQLAEERVKSVR